MGSGIIGTNRPFRGKKYAPQYRPAKLLIKNQRVKEVEEDGCSSTDPQGRQRTEQGGVAQPEGYRYATPGQRDVARGRRAGLVSALPSEDEIILHPAARRRATGEGNPGAAANETGAGSGDEHVEQDEIETGRR